MLVLSLVAQRSGNCNWHTLGRRVLSSGGDPAEFDRAFKFLRDELKFLEEKKVEGEALPKLFLTKEGAYALANSAM
ncbi:hypothetical protein ABIC63_006000 [Pseudacidovorax sp. 1753]|uniref:hypothetical protein n=1 Tax=Pseudacidovorax sp. 1753 TaxID=3156419 RepID=UPI0033951432